MNQTSHTTITKPQMSGYTAKQCYTIIWLYERKVALKVEKGQAPNVLRRTPT